MEEFLFLFHSTVGVVQTRKLLQAAGVPFRVADIPRTLRGGCGLCIRLQCPPGAEQQWVLPGATQAVYRCEGERLSRWQCISRTGKMAPCGLMPSPRPSPTGRGGKSHRAVPSPLWREG